MSDDRIVPMRTGHVRALMVFERELFGPEAWTRGAYLAELADRRHRTYLAVEDATEPNELLGWGGVRVLADEAEILTVGVVPAARRRGVGRRLLTALLDAAAGAGAADVYLEVRVDNDGAQALYSAEGFAEVGRRPGYYENGRVDAVVMHRALRAAGQPRTAGQPA